MAYPISNVYRRVQYSGSAGTGPYSFSFEILSNTDVSVYKNQTLLTLTTDYTVTINANGTGSITLVSAATGSDTITIYGARAIERTSDFVTGGDLFANTLNDELDSLVIFTQQNKEEISRSLMAPVTDPTTIDLTLPKKTDRAGYVLSFNSSTGNPEVTTTVGQINQAQTYAANALTSQNAAAASAAAALVSQGAAATSASASAASASAAAASVNGGMYSAVQDKSANYTVAVTDAGDLIRVDTSAGVVTITLPTIDGTTITDGFKVAVVKWTNDANAVTVARSSTNTINGGTTYSIGSQYTSATFVADAETGQWFGAASGVGTANIVSDVFSGTGSQTVFTLSGDPGSKNNTFVYVGGVYQQKATYTQSGSTITFSAAPPSGTGNVEIIWIQPQAIGVPSDGTVSTAKIVDANVTLAKLSATGTPSSTTYLRGDNTWATIQAGFNGAATTSSAVDITLTSASAQTQVITMTAANKYVILPDATTMLTKGGSAFIIQNKGSYPFSVKNSAGTIVAGPVTYGNSVQLDLVSNSTAEGAWAQVATAGLVGIGLVNVSTLTPTDSGTCRVVAMSSTQALIFYMDSTTSMKVVLATVSGSTVTYGTPVTVSSSLSGGESKFQAASLSSGTAVVTAANATTIYAFGVTLSGSTITVGSATTITSSASYSNSAINVFASSSTNGIVAYTTDNGANNVASVIGFTISGTTITFGSAQTLLSLATGASIGTVVCTKLATGSFVCLYGVPISSAYARTFTVSGSTVTLGTQTTFSGVNNLYAAYYVMLSNTAGYAASSTCAVMFQPFYGVDGYFILNISGTTISSSISGLIRQGLSTSFFYQPNNTSLFGNSAGMTSDPGGGVWLFTGNSSIFGGSINVGWSGLSRAGSCAQLDSTTNIITGYYGSYLGAVITKAN